MRVLAVDTTGAHGSVGIVSSGELEGLIGARESRPKHAESLLPTIDALLKRLSIDLAGVDAFAVAVGPGSFTGLRIGIAAVEGLSFATGKPVAGVSALEATAFRYRHREGLIVPLIEAYRGEVYAAAYRSDAGSLRLEVEPACATVARCLATLPEAPALVAGSAVARHREEIRTHAPGALVADRTFFIAEEVARLAVSKLEAGEAAPLGSLVPLYIRLAEAERNRGV
jgi:tRNA threonylcarbamoyladenosine biosynthesis protein TsaB